MPTIKTYILIEALSISNANRDNLFNIMTSILSQGSGTQPADSMHSRTRLDGNAIILECNFNSEDITISKTKENLGIVFDVLPSLIGNTNNNQNLYGLESILSYPLSITNRVRYIAFGYNGDWSTWNESRLACSQYITDNNAEWNETE